MIFLLFIKFTYFSLNKSKRTRLDKLESSRLVFNYNLQTKRCFIYYLRTIESTLTAYENSKGELRVLVHSTTQIPFKLEFKEHACSYLNKNFDLVNSKNKRKLLRFFTESNDKVINKNDFIIEMKPKNSVCSLKYEEFLTPIESPSFRVGTSQERKKLQKDFKISPLAQNLTVGVCLPCFKINDISLTVFLVIEEEDRYEKISINKGFNCKFVYSINVENSLKSFFEGTSFMFLGKEMRIIEKGLNWKNLTLEDVIKFFKQLCGSNILPSDISFYK